MASMLPFVQSASTKDGRERVPVFVSLMQVGHALVWHGVVQPHIDAAAEPRADKGWDWRILRTMFPLAEVLRRRRCYGYSVFALDRHNMVSAAPVGMVLLIERYPYLANPSQDSTFVWFLSAAPAEALKSFDGIPLSLGGVLLDIAITTSINTGTEGRIALHCAPAGGPRLLKFYEKNGLARLPEAIALPAPWENDGRYFHADSTIAARLSAAYNPYREPWKG